jgi:hypothetical protein
LVDASFKPLASIDASVVTVESVASVTSGAAPLVATSVLSDSLPPQATIKEVSPTTARARRERVAGLGWTTLGEVRSTEAREG